MPNHGDPSQRHGTPPWAPSCRPHSAQSRLARMCAVGLVTSPTPTPCVQGKQAVGPGSTPQGRAIGGGRVPDPGYPLCRREAPASGVPRAAPTARKASSQERALWGWRWVPKPAPPMPTENGQRPPAVCPKEEWLGEGQCAAPDIPHEATRSQPQQDALLLLGRRTTPARNRVRCRSVTRPHVRTPRTHRRRAVGPDRSPERQAVGGGRVPCPGHASQRQEAPTTSALGVPPQRAKGARKSVRCGVGDGPPCPQPGAPPKQGTGPRPPAPRTNGRGAQEPNP